MYAPVAVLATVRKTVDHLSWARVLYYSNSASTACSRLCRCSVKWNYRPWTPLLIIFQREHKHGNIRGERSCFWDWHRYVLLDGTSAEANATQSKRPCPPSFSLNGFPNRGILNGRLLVPSHSEVLFFGLTEPHHLIWTASQTQRWVLRNGVQDNHVTSHSSDSLNHPSVPTVRYLRKTFPCLA